MYVTVDGRFGAAALAAVRAFQTEAGITVTGKVDSGTEKLLYSVARGPLRPGAVTVTESVNAVDIARCLTAGANSSDIQVWGCTGAAGQKWALYPVPAQPAQYSAVSQGSHLCLGADSATSGQNGRRIRGRSCDGLPAQRWRFGAAGPNGGRTLVSVPDGFCLDAGGGRLRPGRPAGAGVRMRGEQQPGVGLPDTGPVAAAVRSRAGPAAARGTRPARRTAVARPWRAGSTDGPDAPR
ncbi:RICIN domain-containing protein [Streptomyces sp. NBC_00631]